MGGTTGIEWTDATLNPFTWRCTPVSDECDNCYALALTNRWQGAGAFTSAPPVLRPGRLLLPWTDPKMRAGKRIFFVSMSDPFHDGIAVPDLALAWAVMAADGTHIYQVLTKRHGPMRARLASLAFRNAVLEALGRLAALAAGRRLTPARRRILGDIEAARASFTWPLPNVWLGVSAGTQRWADIRIPALLQTPAAVRFVSAEPLLGPLILRRYLAPDKTRAGRPGLDWVIGGGESGPGARPMDLAWMQAIRSQCDEASAAIFVKQLGAVWARGRPGADPKGSNWETWPGALRVRQFPAARAA
jgi:protein gp37